MYDLYLITYFEPEVYRTEMYDILKIAEERYEELNKDENISEVYLSKVLKYESSIASQQNKP